jgi:DNA-binding transcriptional ArsR family regulator
MIWHCSWPIVKKHSSGNAKMNSASLDVVFGALSNPTRRTIIAKLANGESSVTELAEPFEMSLPAITKHLDVLEQARIITRVKKGRVHLCRIQPERLEKAAGWIRSYEAMWNRQLDSLSGYLETSREKR